MIRLLRRVLAVTLLGVAAGPVALGAPADAAACAGVTVVVNSSVGCDADGGGRAANNFTDAGHRLRYASRAPGFVCQVDGLPAEEPCVEAAPPDAYWGLFWSDGTSGKWVYSSLGASSLRVPQGGAVAFVFQGSTTRTWPSVAAPVAAAPEPSRATTRPGGSAPGSSTRDSKAEQRTPKARSTAGTAAASPSPGSSVPTTAPSASVPTPSASASTGPTSVPTSSASTEVRAAEVDETVTPLADSGSEGTSTAARVAGAVVVVLLAAAAAIVVRRRGRA